MTKSKLPNTFEDLVAEMPPHAISDEADYDKTIEMLDRLVCLCKMTKGQEQYLETLSILIEAYENEHYPIDTSNISSLDMLKHFMEMRAMNASQLGELLGDRSLGSKILKGERQLSKKHINILAKRFKVDPELFL